jgi:crossover junction endodeoxyribonuclease RuvC
VDPGSRLTGWGVVDLVGNQLKAVGHGALKASRTSGRQEVSLADRLLVIHDGLSRLIEQHRPAILVVERVFFAKNAASALSLGQARGVAVLTGAIHSLEVVEYSPSEVKQSLVGHGQAEKSQVAKMLQLLLGPQEFVTSDASDGLALAVCHAQTLGSRGAFGAQAVLGPKASRASGKSMADALGITPEMVQGKARFKRERGGLGS